MSDGEALSREPGSARLGRLLAAALAVLGAILVAVAARAVTHDGLRLLLGCVLGWSLLALAWIDWRQYRLPDALTLPLLGLGLLATALQMPDQLGSSVVGVIAGYAALRLIDCAYRRLRGRDGLGQGDAKLLAAGGAWLGWEALPSVVLLAAVLGLALALILSRRGAALRRDMMLPFGPPLALAIWVAWLAGMATG